MRSFFISVLSSLVLIVSACGGGGGGGTSNSSRASSSSVSPPPPTMYTLTTQVTGNGSIAPLSEQVTAGTTQAFTLAPQAGYEVDSVSGCAGSLVNQVFTTAVINAACGVSVTFSPIDYSLGGTVNGLSGTVTLSLAVNNEQELLPLAANGAFTFLRALNIGQGYQIAINSQPAGQTCELTNDFGEFATANINNIMVSCIANNATASISGKITAAAGILVDTTVNDRFATYVDNSIPSKPQLINNRATLHGFASKTGTGGDSTIERFTNTFNEDDYYRVSLQAGQVIQLQVVDFDNFDVDSLYKGDLDLYLFPAQGGNVVTFSNSVTEYEEIIVPANGDYLVNVWAYEGISKYVLRILPPNTQTFAVSSSEEFVAHEMIVQLKKEPANGVKMKAKLGSLATLSHTDTNRPALIKTQSQVVSFASAQGQKASPRNSRALAELQQMNPAIYDQIVTLRNIKAVRLQDGVEYVEPNYRRYAQRVPNDPGYINQWHYSAIGLPQAWEISTGAKPAGQEVLVAVIDTGVFLDHIDLAGQLIAGYDFIADSQSAGDGNGIDVNADDPGDSNQRGQSSWHGTHVAGTIAAASNNSTGAAGVAWGARIMPIRVLGKDGGTSYDVMQGLRYAARLSNDSGTLPARRADIANLSLGGGGGSLAEQNAYAAARATGMIIVAAAGNDSTSSPSYPAAYESVISVSATDFLNQKTSYSNYGSTITVAAPGGDVTADLSGDGSVDGVLSLVADDTSGSRKSAYGFYEGTSMAAPHVAGVLALMKAVHPALTPAQVDNLLQAGAITDDLGAVGRDNNFGYGLINALKAVRAASDLAAGAPLPELPPQLRITPTSLNLGLSVSATVTVSNQGGGDPQVTSVTDDRSWLSISSVTIDGKGLGGYRISTNRTGLEDGYYQGQVIFTIDSVQQLTLAVNMQVGNVASAGQLTQMYVLLLDSDTQESVQQAIPVRSGSALNYTFTDVPIGDYTLIAGSDIDVDLYICQSGEVCGAYPSLALRQIISVKGVDLTGVDLVADILGNFSESNAAAQHPSSKSVAVNELVGHGVRRLVSP